MNLPGCKGYSDQEFQKVFWSKVEKLGKDKCWPWRGNRRSDGYGKYKRKGKQFLAHRYALESKTGPLPKGVLACHHCDNPICCNPDHLFVGTHLDNNRDSKSKGRNSFGERRPLAKLTDSAVKEILSISKGIRGEAQSIAARFNVSRRLIRAIIRRERWTHI